MVAKAGDSRFCYCYCQECGRTDKTKLAGRDDSTVRYCQVRNIIAAQIGEAGQSVVGDEDGLSKVEGGR